MGMMKFARASGWRQAAPLHILDSQVKIADLRLPIKEGHYVLDDWAISSYEDWGPNDNGDGFERGELKRAYKTFVGSWACLDHENWHETLAVGENIDAVYTPQNYVKVLMSINRKKAEARHPGLENKIKIGKITDSSMGAWCKLSVCSVCGNKASDPSGFCPHVRTPIRGTIVCNAMTNWKEITACELNRGVVFFENSIITNSEGADGRAKIIEVLASRTQGLIHQAGVVSVPGDKLYKVMRKMASEASGEQERMWLSHFAFEIGRVLDEGGE